jgi:hypothetical protein
MLRADRDLRLVRMAIGLDSRVQWARVMEVRAEGGGGAEGSGIAIDIIHIYIPYIKESANRSATIDAQAVV